MKIYLKTFVFLLLLLIGISSISAQAREIPNLLSAVKTANPGDYIVLPSGRKYILTRGEIDIVNGTFNYDELADVETETLNDGTEIKTISEAHIVYIYPDGQSTHIIKTTVSFTEFMQQYIEKKYFLGHYVDVFGNYHDSGPNGSPKFYVFRASVQFRTISNGVDEAEEVMITAYNYKGENFIMHYFSTGEGWLWGYVNGNYSPIGETRQVEFDIE
jgi:hypothetical protein